MLDPGGSSADALAINSNDIAIFSKANDWGIIASRDWEIAIVGVASIEIKESFLTSFGDSADMFFLVQEQVEVFCEMLDLHEERRLEYKTLIENYKDNPAGAPPVT